MGIARLPSQPSSLLLYLPVEKQIGYLYTGKLGSGHVRVWSKLLSKGLFEKCNRRDRGVE